MKKYAILGFILISVGIVVLAYQGITYASRGKVVDLGAMDTTTERTETLPYPPIMGALALAGGIAVLVTGSQKGPKKESKRQYRRWLL